MGTALYIRVSTDRQHKEGVSLETQKKALYAYCELRGFKDVKLYPDVGSARTTRRDNYENMMRDVKQGNIKNIIIYKLDRLTRSLIDLNNTVKELNHHGCGLHSCMENIDSHSAMGRMVMNLIGTFAQWESESTSEKVSVNMDYLTEQGVWMSAIPYGFFHGDDKKLKIKEDEANILREAFDRILGGHSATSTERMIKNKYDLNWSENFLIRKIRAESTIGNIMRNKKVIEGTHEGIITKEEQIKLLQIIEGNRTARKFIDHNDVFRRRVVCYQCNYIMSVNAHSKDNYETAIYSYFCSNCYKKGMSTVSVSENVVLEAFKKYMKELPIRKFDAVGLNEVKDESKPIKNRLKSIHDELDNIQRAWIKRMISDEDLMKYRNELDIERNQLEDELAKLGVVKPIISVSDLKEIVSSFNELFSLMDREDQRDFIQRHIMKIHFSRKLVEGYKKKYDVRIKLVEFF